MFEMGLTTQTPGITSPAALLFVRCGGLSRCYSFALFKRRRTATRISQPRTTCPGFPGILRNLHDCSASGCREKFKYCNLKSCPVVLKLFMMSKVQCVFCFENCITLKGYMEREGFKLSSVDGENTKPLPHILSLMLSDY